MKSVISSAEDTVMAIQAPAGTFLRAEKTMVSLYFTMYPLSRVYNIEEKRLSIACRIL